MEDEKEYITNNDTDELTDEETLKKLKKVEEELSKVKSELDEKSKLCLEQKHKIDELTGEYNNLKSEKDNLQDLVHFSTRVKIAAFRNLNACGKMVCIGITYR